MRASLLYGLALLLAPLAALGQPVADRDADLAGMPAEVRGEIQCQRNGDFSNPDNLAKAREKVPDSYRAWLRAGLNGAMGTGKDGFGVAWGGQVEGSVGLLHPLYLGGGVRWLSFSQVQLDAVAGFTFRSYGTTWIKAGSQTTVTDTSAITYRWNSNCQVRRTDYALIGGAKYVYLGGSPAEPGLPATASTHATALQFGLQSVERRTASSPQGGWSVSALYDPIQAGYGLQGSYTGQGVLLAVPGPDMIYTGLSAGVMFSKNFATFPFWFTVDIGAAFEL